VLFETKCQRWSWHVCRHTLTEMGTILVTGASTGIGEACALRLAGAGHRVLAGVRRDDDGRRLAERSGSIEPVMLDVTDATAIATLRERVAQQEDGGLDGLVNNAGVARGGPLEFLPLDEWRQQFEVNVIGQVAVTQALLPALRVRRGRIVFVGSISGRVATPFLAPYGASKHALEAVAEALREELRAWGLPVVVVEPGAVRTPIWGKGRAYADEIERRLPAAALALYAGAIDQVRRQIDAQEQIGVAPDAVAAVVERALTAARPRYRYLVGRDAKVAGALERFLPDRVMSALVRRMGP
jgi:NAD(P)-dependent dehydrogenase (short-subunit alcohol dehydrogenase family)